MEGKRRFVSLKARIMISTLVPVIISFILISAVVFGSLFRSLSETARADFLQVSQSYAHSFEGKISSAMNYLSVLASELEAQAGTGAVDREELQRTVFKVFDDYSLIDGSSVYFERNMYDGKDDEYIGTEYGTAKSGRICWYYFAEDGKTAYMPEGLSDDVEFDLPHYTEAKKANEPIYTDPVVHEIDGRHIPMFTLTYPLNDKNGEFIGAVTVDLYLDDIYSRLQSQKIYETGYVIIANDNERIVYSPIYENIGKTREEAGLNYPIPAGSEKTAFFHAISMINGEETLATINSIYIPQLDRYFYVSVAAPINEINAGGASMMIWLILFGLFIVVVIALLLYYLVGKLSAPLNEITRSIDKIASGDYNARIEGSYKGEFAVVKDSVNTMAGSIEAYIREYENSIKIFQNILNGLDAYIYVTDPDSGTILFINDDMKEAYGIEDDGIGQICYKVLQEGVYDRCDFCPCYELDVDPDKTVVWEEHSTATKRHYRNTDRYIEWLGGVRAHLQHSVDITDIKRTQISLDKRLSQQALMTSISQNFLSGADIDTLITNALRMAGEFMGVSQVLFYELDSDNATIVCRDEWINPELGLETRINSKFKLNDALLGMLNGLSAEQGFCLSSDNSAIKEAMASYRMSFQSFITAPVFLKDKVCAMLDFSRDDDGGQWSESDKNLAVLLASLLSGVFERNTMEGQLRRLSSIVEKSPQFIIYITADGHVDYVNPAAVTITGYTEAEMIEGGLDLIFDENTAMDIKQKYIPDTLQDGTGSFEIDLICKDGHKHIMSFSTCLTGSDSGCIGGIASDVTEIRKLEAELIAAKELAEQGSRSKSEFLSRMSHEMRTPMNAVIGMTSIAKSSKDPEKKEYCLEKIDNASRHLLGVINDILDMSKIEADKFDLSYTEFSFERMLQRVLDVINFRIDEKRQVFSLYIDPAIPAAVIGDEQRLSQVITNLLSNAVKFTPEGGGIQLNVNVVGTEGDASILRVEVADSGIGISSEQMAKLFRSFEQADGSIARKFGGTGLGLAISKRIVELMDGKIWVESELDKGSKFIFTFKAEKGDDSAVDTFRKQINISDLNIMAVDDSQEVCDYFRHVMDEIGAPCAVASGGKEALELFKSSDKPFDIVFIDWKMPEMNGVELTRELRKITDANPIIIMISVAEWSDIEKDAVQAGVNGFVPKPLFPSLLLDCINKHMGGVVAEDTESGEASELHSFEGRTALLAEDVDINREIVLTVLEDTMLKIDCAENGREAIEMFAADPGKYDIIFMDVHMPEIDGLEATRRIRALDAPEGAKVPIVAMTANVFREDIERCRDAGMNDHIGKPIDFDELFDTLRKYLG